VTNIKKYTSVVLWSPHGFENEIKVDLIKMGGEWDPQTVLEVSVYDYTVLCSA